MLWPPRILLPLLLLPLLTQGGCARSVPPGSLPGDQVWQGRVLIEGDLIVPAGTTLTLRPGTEVLFSTPRPGADAFQEHPHFPGAELIVAGTLLAHGTPTQPVSFRHVDPQAPPGSWGGVNLMQSPRAEFRFCRFTQADSALHSNESARVSVSDSRFERNLVGIRFHSTDILVERNLLRDNGTAIRFHFGAPVIRANRIEANDRGLFITSHPRDYRIEGNQILASREYHVVLGEEVPEDVRLSGNYWGDAAPDEVAAQVLDGRRVPYLGRVVIEPRLVEPPAESGPACGP